MNAMEEHSVVDGEHGSPSGPRAMAAKLVVQIDDLEAELAVAVTDPMESKRLRKALAMNRKLLRWCKTRAGY